MKIIPNCISLRDFPDKYHEGDFPMIDKDKIKALDCEMVFGDLKKTIPSYKKKLTKNVLKF